MSKRISRFTPESWRCAPYCLATPLQTAEIADVTQRTVQMWIERFELDGIDGLRDSPNRGRKPKVPVGRIKKIATKLRRTEKLTPKKLCNWVRRRLHVTYSVGSIRRILRTMGFSLKTSTTKLADAADEGGKTVAKGGKRHDCACKKARI